MDLDLSEDDIKFLKELGKELNTQDNRYTADPYFYVIKEPEEIVGMDSYLSDKTVWCYSEDCEAGPFDSEEEALKYLIDNCEMDEKQAAREFELNFDEYGVLKQNKKSNVFLTEKACHAHMKANKHRYHKDAYSFADYAFRNPEMERLIQILKKIGDK